MRSKSKHKRKQMKRQQKHGLKKKRLRAKLAELKKQKAQG